MIMKTVVFWIVTPFSFVDWYCRCEGTCCPHLQSCYQKQNCTVSHNPEDQNFNDFRRYTYVALCVVFKIVVIGFKF